MTNSNTSVENTLIAVSCDDLDAFDRAVTDISYLLFAMGIVETIELNVRLRTKPLLVQRAIHWFKLRIVPDIMHDELRRAARQLHADQFHGTNRQDALRIIANQALIKLAYFPSEERINAVIDYLR